MQHGAAFATRLRDLFGGGRRRTRDAAAGLSSPAAFDHKLDVELERARRLRGTAALLLIELEGPADLAAVGRTLATGKRGYDSAARVGETRFVVLAPDSDEHGAYVMA